MRIFVRAAAVVALGALLVADGSGARDAVAEGWSLDGRQAPDLVFAAGGVNGISPGGSLAQFRGKVVWLKFWLRDCPICRRTLPDVQAAHARWGKQGLVVLTVLHGFGPSDPALNRFLRENGYTFPVASDLDGRQAALYGVNVRPTDYLIGADGRVKSSNGVPQATLEQELGRYRLARLDPVPDSFKSVRDQVWRNEVAPALRGAATIASSADAPAEAKAGLARVEALAREDIAGRGGWAAWLAAQRRLPEARQAADALLADYRGTSLEAEAAQARAAVPGAGG